MSKLEPEKGTVLDTGTQVEICNYDPFCERESTYVAKLMLERTGKPLIARQLACCTKHLEVLRDQVGAHQEQDIRIGLAFGRRSRGR